MIHPSRRRTPLIAGGGSSLPAAVATKVFSVMGADAFGSMAAVDDSDGSVMVILGVSTAPH
jgi:hypothetical protein